MNLQVLQKRAFEAAKKRGKVSDKTTIADCVCAMTVEVAEFANAKEVGNIKDFYERMHLIDISTNKAIVNDEQERYDKAFVKTYKGMMAGTVADELADWILIAFTTAEMHGIDIEKAVLAKQRYNELR